MMIDVASYQGTIDWKKVKKSGISEVIIRCGISNPSKCKTDSKFKQNIECALANGFKVGLYYYSYSKTEAGAKQEADYAMKIAKPYKDKLTYPIFIDIEEKSCAKYASTVANAFCKRLAENGYEAGVYTTTSIFNNQLKKFSGYMKWVAYLGKNAPSGDYDLWQYSWSGKVDGIAADVDLNTWLKQPTPKPQPTPEPKGDTCMLEVKVLKKGDRCYQVKTVQRILRELGYKVKGKLIAVDGSYGPVTDNCVKQFQQNWGLKVTGIVDEITWSRLIKGN